ncbi:unnamed protein product [Microthlaspi erraticum]|uniref:FBD domain-containing protein n=1 Tax=Microthlaspi erraticum TaxID=1685480 RepID=A0A6D2IQ48_9BRAS|nr:unnamed protein product [Microthlaspi erraticum]
MASSSTTNISFKESEFVNSVSGDEETKRAAFVRHMVRWLCTFSGEDIESFEICLSKPMGFETEIIALIEFVVSRKVKNFVLDFSDPSWTAIHEAQEEAEASVFQLPECVYSEATTLESLKLFACGFDQSKFPLQGSLKRLCFGWTQLGKIMALLSKSPLLESLSLHHCWNIDMEEAVTETHNPLRELVFQNCDFATEYSTLDLPNIQIFKYTGSVHCFQFMRVNRIMEEVYLEFDKETEQDEATATILCGLLYDLLSARKLTVCPFLIQAIKHSEDPVRLQAAMETNHLVIRSSVKEDDFVGVRFMVNSCPDLHTLTFELVPPGPAASTTAVGFDPATFWLYGSSHGCLRNTLKVVEVRNFNGDTYVFQVLMYLMRWGLVMERLDFYLPSGVDEDHKAWARYAATKVRNEFAASSNVLQVYLHNG